MRVTTVVILPALLYILIFLWPLCDACNSRSVTGLLFLGLLIVPLLMLSKKRLGHFTLLTVVAVLSLHAQWGIFQFVLQQDFNLYLLGESPLSIDTAGIAKFSLGTEKVIRAYGPYPHANVFGGAMLIALLLTNSLPRSTAKHILTATFLLALIVSFSRLALIGYLVHVGFEILHAKRFPSSRLFIYFLVLLALGPLLWFRAVDPAGAAVSERLRGYTWSLGIIQEQSWWTGVGIRQYESAVKRYLDNHNISYATWEIAPVHSVPLLLASELGILLTTILVLMIIVLTGRQLLLFLPIVPPLLFDHYFMTELSSLFLLVVLYTAIHGGGISQKYRERFTRTAS